MAIFRHWVKLTITPFGTPAKRRDLNTVLLFDHTKDIPFSAIISPSNLLDLAVTPAITVTDKIYKDTEEYFSQTPRPNLLYVYGRDLATATMSVKEALIELEDDPSNKNVGGWYKLITTFEDQVNITSASEYLESALPVKTGFFQLNEALTTPTQALTISKAINNRRVALFYTDVSTDQIDKKSAGYFQSYRIGRIAFNAGRLFGVSSTGLTTTDELAFINSEFPINTIHTERLGVKGLAPGKMTNGEYIEFIHFEDWLDDAIHLAWSSAMVRETRIPLDSKGQNLVYTLIEQVLQEASNLGILRSQNGDPLGEETNSEGIPVKIGQIDVIVPDSGTNDRENGIFRVNGFVTLLNSARQILLDLTLKV